MNSLRLLFILSVSFLLTSCGLLSNLDSNPQARGTFTPDDLSAFSNKHGEVCSFPASPGHLALPARFAKEFTGQYVMERDPRTGLVEMGQIDLAIDFSDNREIRDRTRQADLNIIRISKVTSFPEVAPDLTVGWVTEIEEAFGDVSWTEPVGTETIPPDVRIDISLRKNEITRDGDTGGATGIVDQVYTGIVLMDGEASVPPLGICGEVVDGFVKGVFYLEEVSGI